MKQITLNELLAGYPHDIGTATAAVEGISYRSDEVRRGDAFFCISGFVHDGHDFADDAVDRGAAALVVQRRLDISRDVPQILVEDTREALALASARFFGEPSREMTVVGITGTNGKTTTTYLTDSIFRSAGYSTGLVGTVETRIAEEVRPAGRTTPESADLQALLSQMRDKAVTHVSMEVSSHAIDLHRVDSMRFAVAGFTNLTQDHLDYHHTLEEYFSVKRRLFTHLDVGRRVVNVDDPFGEAMAAELGDVLRVGTDSRAEVIAKGIELSPTGSRFLLQTSWGEREIRLPLAGEFNVSNALVAAGVALASGIELDNVVAGLGGAPQVPGRLERIDVGQPFGVYVDYAHTPDGLAKAIEAVRAVTSRRVVVVFGCGGDRDPEKRPLMGEAAASMADHVVVTSDNPRSEDPVGIILQIEDGVRRGTAEYEVHVDRRSAIAAALSFAEDGDSVLVAGKGHEDYQIFADRTIHFDDRQVVREELARLC